MAHIRHFSEIEQRRKDRLLTPAEEKLIQACKDGVPCILEDGQRPEQDCTDPERLIHADILRYLILGGCAQCPVAENGVDVEAAIIIEKLDLDNCIAKGFTVLDNCRIDQPITAMHGQFQILSLDGSHIQGLMAQGAIIKGDVFLSNGFHAKGAVDLNGAEIGGQLACIDGRFDHPTGKALNAQGAIIKGDVFLNNDFHATGAVDLSGAEIGGQLDCDNGRFENPNGDALKAQRAIIKEDVFLNNDFHATGAVDLSGAKIGGQLDCINGRFDNPTGDALNAQGAIIKDAVFLSNGFHATGSVDLNGAEIGGQLACIDGRFDNPNGDALYAQGAIIKESVFLSDNFHATGSVDLNGAKIGGQLDCDNGRFENPKGDALNAQGAIIKGSVFLNNDFHATGAVDLSGAEIGGQLDCIDGRFDNPEDNSKDDEGKLKFPQSGLALKAQVAIIKGDVFLRNKFHATGAVDLNGAEIGGQLSCTAGRFDHPTGKALNAQGAIIKDSVFLRNGFHATGAVDLNGAKIGGQLACIGGQFDNPTGDALNAQGAIIKDAFIWCEVKNVMGSVDLVNMHCDTLVDDQASWRLKKMTYDLEGMTYNRINAMYFSHDHIARLAWLRKGSIDKFPDHDAFTPQPYSQYAACMRKMGHDPTARKVLLQREKFINKFAREDAIFYRKNSFSKFLQGLYNFFPWATDFIQQWLIGYGHDLKRALIFTFLLWLCAIPLAHKAWQAGAITPNSAVILTSADWLHYQNCSTPNIAWAEKSPIGQNWSSFNRYAWAADVVIPLVEFGQTNAWTPSKTNGGWGKALWIAQWVFSFLGWVSVGMFVAGLTGITRRD